MALYNNLGLAMQNTVDDVKDEVNQALTRARNTADNATQSARDAMDALANMPLPSVELAAGNAIDPNINYSVQPLVLPSAGDTDPKLTVTAQSYSANTPSPIALGTLAPQTLNINTAVAAQLPTAPTLDELPAAPVLDLERPTVNLPTAPVVGLAVDAPTILSVPTQTLSAPTLDDIDAAVEVPDAPNIALSAPDELAVPITATAGALPETPENPVVINPPSEVSGPILEEIEFKDSVEIPEFMSRVTVSLGAAPAINMPPTAPTANITINEVTPPSAPIAPELSLPTLVLMPELPSLVYSTEIPALRDSYMDAANAASVDGGTYLGRTAEFVQEKVTAQLEAILGTAAPDEFITADARSGMRNTLLKYLNLEVDGNPAFPEELRVYALSAINDNFTSAITTALDTTRRAFSGRGFTTPPAMMGATLSKAMRDAQRTRREALRDSNESLLKLFYDNQRWAAETLASMEVQYYEVYYTVAQKQLALLSSGVGLLDSISALMVQRFEMARAVAALHIEQINAALAVRRDELEAFRFEIEKHREARAVNAEAIELFNAQVGSLRAQYELYGAQIEASMAPLRVAQARVETFRTQVDLFRTQVEAARVQVDVYGTQVQNEGVKAQLMQAEVAAYDAKIKGLSAKADVDAKIARIKTDIQSLNIDAYRANLEGLRQTLDTERAIAEFSDKQLLTAIEAYKAQTGAARGDAELAIAARRAQIEGQVAVANAASQDYRTRVDAYSAKLSGRVELYKTVSAAKVDSFKAQVDAYRGTVDAISAVNSTSAAIYESRVRAATSEAQANADVFRANVDAAIGAGRLRVDVAKSINDAQASLYAARASAYTASAGAHSTLYAAQLDAFRAATESTTRIEGLRVEAYRAQTDAASVAFRANVDARRSELDAATAIESLRLDAFRTDYSAQVAVAQVKGEAFRARKAAEAAYAQSTIAAYEAQSRVGIANADARIRVAIAESDRVTRLAIANTETQLRASQILSDNIKGAATIAASIASGAMASYHVGAQLSASGGSNTTYNESLSVSDTNSL